VFDVYLITAERSSAEIVAACKAALLHVPRERVGLQLRARHVRGPELTDLAHALRALTRAHGVALLVSADLELASAVGADGVQLPEEGPPVGLARTLLGPHALVGASRHDARGIAAAHEAGASFATLSPVFQVAGKGEPLGVQGLGTIARATALPTFALGGITAAHASTLVEHGAHGVAVIREVFDAPEPAQALRHLLDAVASGRAARAGGPRDPRA
jgi:thiamine-phosphate diphosphorylase